MKRAGSVGTAGGSEDEASSEASEDPFENITGPLGAAMKWSARLTRRWQGAKDSDDSDQSENNDDSGAIVHSLLPCIFCTCNMLTCCVCVHPVTSLYRRVSDKPAICCLNVNGIDGFIRIPALLLHPHRD